ncbi:MAG: hypothetical protein Ct9H300mP25_02360 [Acidobacteriota bacterium]|nr:MAG: hypothetical protein Ct9H300mP25_02360 [Acidobacteriota bacterium]
MATPLRFTSSSVFQTYQTDDPAIESDRMVHYMRGIDTEVLEAWQSSSVLRAVDEYVQRTLKK